MGWVYIVEMTVIRCFQQVVEFGDTYFCDSMLLITH